MHNQRFRFALDRLFCRWALWTAAFFATSVTSPQAAVINFAPLSQPGAGFNNVGGLVIQNGFQFTSSLSTLGTWQDTSPNHPVGGVPATSLTEFFAAGQTTMTQVGGAPFDLLGIDLAGYSTAGSGPFNVTFTGTKSDSSIVQQTFTPLNANGLQPVLQPFSFNSNFTDVVSVNFTQGFNGTNAYQFNNVVLNPAAPPPLPTSWRAGPDLVANERPDGPQELLNPNGTVPQWRYGYREVAADANMTLFSAAAGEHTNNGSPPLSLPLEGWQTPGYYLSIPFVFAGVDSPLNPDFLVMHPQDAAGPRTFVVVRWTAPLNQSYRVSATWADGDAVGGDGVDVHIFKSGVESVFDSIIANGGAAAFPSTLIALTAGDTLDFVVGPGPNGDFFFDTTVFSATIVPEPSTFVLHLLAMRALSCPLRLGR